jgi:hypothetical protein
LFLLGTWREKMDFVHPLYPENCTDDFGIQDQEIPLANSHLELQKYHYFDQIVDFADGPELPVTLQDHTHTKKYLISKLSRFQIAFLNLFFTALLILKHIFPP